MSGAHEFKIGDMVTVDVDGRVRGVFTVERIQGRWLDGAHRGATVDSVRPWRPGDDEEAQRWEDQGDCARFERWADLSAEDAAAVAAVVRKYKARPVEDF